MNPEYDNNTPTTPQPQQPNPQQPSPEYGAAPAGSPAPKNNKTLLWASIVIVILVIIGAVVFLMNRSSDKKDDSNKTTNTSTNSASNGNTNTANSKFETYDVKDPLGNYTVSFYKGATTLDKNSLHYLVAGSQGSQTSAYLSVGSGTQLDCQGAPSTTMNIAGQATKVCYQTDGKVYSGQLAVKGVATRVNVAGQQSVSMADAKAILESFSFK